MRLPRILFHLGSLRVLTLCVTKPRHSPTEPYRRHLDNGKDWGKYDLGLRHTVCIELTINGMSTAILGLTRKPCSQVFGIIVTKAEDV